MRAHKVERLEVNEIETTEGVATIYKAWRTPSSSTSIAIFPDEGLSQVEALNELGKALNYRFGGSKHFVRPI